VWLLLVGASEIWTASAAPDECQRSWFHLPDAQRRQLRLPQPLLRGSRCSLPPQSSLWESAALSLLGFTTSVASMKRLCFTALSANTWLPLSSKPKIGIPAASVLASFAPSLSASCAADSSATASPVFAVRLATMSCWWLFPVRIGVSVHHAGRRMADSAVLLGDHVFPAVPVRQWVLTLPMQLRVLLAWRPKLIGLTLTLFLRALFRGSDAALGDKESQSRSPGLPGFPK